MMPSRAGQRAAAADSAADDSPAADSSGPSDATMKKHIPGSEDDGLDVDAARQDGIQERSGLGTHTLSVQVHGALRTVCLLRSGRLRSSWGRLGHDRGRVGHG